VEMVVLEEEWKMRMFEGSFKLLTKIDKFIFLISRRDSTLKMLEFGIGSCIEVIANDVSIPTRLTSLNLKF